MLITNDERRVFRRMAVDAAITVTLGEIKFQGTCKDLSSTGMLIQLFEANLNPGDQVQVLLTTQDSRFPPLEAQANVLRVEKKDGFYTIATEFLNVK